jgi:hypothetical protein
MANLFKREFRPAQVEQENVRSLQSNATYLMDLFARKKWAFIAGVLMASTLVIMSHPQSSYSAKNIITLQQNSLNQSGLTPPTEMTSLQSKPDSFRDRQINFLSSFDFKRLVAEALLQTQRFSADELASISSLNGGFLTHLRGWKRSKLNEDLLAERLQHTIKVTPNNDNNIQLEVIHRDAATAQKLSQFISDFATSSITHVQLQTIELQRSSLLSQITSMKAEMTELAGELHDFKKRNNIISTTAIPEDLRNSLSNLSRNLVESEIKLQETNDLLAQAEAQAVVGTEGSSVSFTDQVLLLKIQEFKDTKSSLEAKIRGTKKILAKENNRFQFYTAGEETLVSLRKRIGDNLEGVSQLEQKLKQVDNLKSQINHSVRVIDKTFVQQRAGQVPLGVKLLFLNVIVLLLTGMSIFYWYEIFPVLSYKDAELVKLNLLASPYSVPEGFGKGLSRQLVHQAEVLFAKSLVGRLGKSGVYQFLSISPKEGKSHLVSIVADYLATQGASVCIVSLTGKEKYPSISSNIKVISKRSEIDAFIENPQSLSFYAPPADWVLVDSHSIEKDIGHMLVSSQMDGIILIGSYLETKRDQFIDWRLKLEHMASPSVHFVLNKTNLREDMPFLLKAQMKKEKTTLRKVS